MAKVLVAGKVHPDGMAILQAEPGLEIETFDDPGAALPIESLIQADALLIRYGVITAEQAAQMEKLRIVSRHGVGCDNLPVDFLSSRGVPVTIVGPVNAISVAEQVMAMVLALTKKIISSDGAVRDGNWNYRSVVSLGQLTEKKILLLGFGRIGREVAVRAAAFGMHVLVFDPFVDAGAIRDAGYEPVPDWKEVLPEVDVLSLHLPATPETMGIIDAGELSAMKPSGIVINAARGGLVDEDALFDALSGPMAEGGAGLDCLSTEPPPDDLGLLELPNVVFSPHSAALSAEATRAMGVVAAKNVVDGLRARLDPALVFNLRQLDEAGYGI